MRIWLLLFLLATLLIAEGSSCGTCVRSCSCVKPEVIPPCHDITPVVPPKPSPCNVVVRTVVVAPKVHPCGCSYSSAESPRLLFAASRMVHVAFGLVFCLVLVL